MGTHLTYKRFVDRLDIDAVEEALDFEAIRQDGANDIGYCVLPYGLHSNGDTTGKLGIHREKMVYNCWVCGGGSILDLAMAVNEMDEEEATQWLFQYTGSEEASTEAFVSKIQGILEPEKPKAETLPYYNENVLTKWLTTDHPWLEERGVQEVADLFKIGFNPQAVKYAPKVNGESIAEPYRGEAIVLPHFWKGKLMGWQHRWLSDDRPKWCAKYTNTPDLPRQDTLFAYDFAARTASPPIIVESVPTAMFLYALGYPAIATFGANVSDAHIKALRGFQNGVILAPDKDEVGMVKYTHARRWLDKFIPVGWIEPHESLPANGDLGDLVSDPELAVNCIENAT